MRRSESRRRGWWMNVRMTGGAQIYKRGSGLALRMHRKADLRCLMMSGCWVTVMGRGVSSKLFVIVIYYLANIDEDSLTHASENILNPKGD